MQLDPVTFLFALSIFGAVMAALAFAFARTVGPQNTGLERWGLCMGIVALIFLLYSQRPVLPAWASDTLPNLLVFPLPVIAAQAYSRLFSVRIGQRLPIVTAVIGALAYLGAMLADLRPLALAIVSLYCALMLGRVVVVIMREADWRHDRSSWMSIFTLGSAAAAFALRSLSVLRAAPTSANGYTDANSLNFMLMAVCLSVIGASLGFFLMANERLRRELVEQARRDCLTGLLSRNGFMQCTAHTAPVAGRASHAVVMVDLDHFKRINDTHGHAAGDAVLREVARRLLGATRERDLVARYGGEEFCLLLHDCDPEQAASLSRRLISAISESPIALPSGDRLTVTASAGVASALACPSAPTAGTNWLERTLDIADRALYAAKAAGRNRVETAAGLS